MRRQLLISAAVLSAAGAAALGWLGSGLAAAGQKALLLKTGLGALGGGALLWLAAPPGQEKGRLAGLLKPGPDWFEPVTDKDLPPLARLALGLAMGRSLQVLDAAKVRRGAAEFFIADVEETGRRGRKRYTLAFASADTKLFPPFRLQPRERGVKLPVNLVEIPGAPNLGAAYFLTTPAPAETQVFFLGGAAGQLSLRNGWRIWCDGRLAALSRGSGLLGKDLFGSFVADAGELLEKVFRLGRNGFTGFHPSGEALLLRSRGK